MRYRDITQTNRFRLPATHPILAEIVIDPVNWYDLQRLNDDNPATRILGYDDPEGGMMTAYIACASDEIKRRLEDGWA